MEQLSGALHYNQQRGILYIIIVLHYNYTAY